MGEIVKSMLDRAVAELPASAPSEGSRDAPPAPGSLPPPSSKLPMIIVAVVVVAAAAWALVSRREAAGETSHRAAAPTAIIERRDFVRSLRIGGTLQAVQSYVITAPEISSQNFSQLTITRLTPAGGRVKKGDVLVEFDRQGQIHDLLDRQAEYRDLVDQIATKQADEAAARAKDDTEVKQAEDDLAKAKLEILKDEIVSRIDAEKNQLTFEEAQARLKALRATYQLKRQAAEAGIHDLEIQRDTKQAAMLHAQENTAKMSMRSPVDGIVVLKSIWKGGEMAEVQEGDQVWTGLPILQVVNPSEMEVRANVNQADVPYLRAGQPARIHLDAYPGATFNGRLEELAPIGVASDMSDKLEQFAATFSLEGSDPKLMPDLSAAVDVELDRVRGALVAPRSALLSDGGRAFVEVKRGAGFEKQEVKVGPVNDTEAVIESGLEPGNVVEGNR